MWKVMMALAVMLAGIPSNGQDNYNELISSVIRACENPRLLLTAACANDVTAYRASCTNEEGRCAANLTWALSLMQRTDQGVSCVARDCDG